MFSGRVELITIHFNRFGNHWVKTLDRNFEDYKYRFPLDNGEGKFIKPDNYKTLINIAEKLSEDFKFMRVDLYNVNGRIFFGELTPYPGGIAARFEPEQMDYHLGNKWEFNLEEL